MGVSKIYFFDLIVFLSSSANSALSDRKAKTSDQWSAVSEFGLGFSDVKTDPDSDSDANPELRKANKIVVSDALMNLALY